MAERKSRTQKIEVVNPSFSYSYQSLFLGIITVFVLFLLIFFGYRFISQKSKGVINQDGATTSVEQQNENSEGASSYTVKEGDTLWSIAERYYKSGYNWVDIAKANSLQNPGAIEKGTQLKIPEVKDIKPTTIVPSLLETESDQETEQPEKIESETYTINKGDYLWDIAVRAYGDGFKWVDIARANNLDNPNIIHSGNTLKIPH